MVTINELLVTLWNDEFIYLFAGFMQGRACAIYPQKHVNFTHHIEYIFIRADSTCVLFWKFVLLIIWWICCSSVRPAKSPQAPKTVTKVPVLGFNPSEVSVLLNTFTAWHSSLSPSNDILHTHFIKQLLCMI